MEFTEVLRRRRMVRNYLPEPVPAEVVVRLCDAARRAPSAGFSQGVLFVAVTDRTTRSRIAELAGEAAYVAAGHDPWISAAPLHVVVCVREESYHERYREADKVGPDGQEIDWPVPYWWVDAGASMMLLLMAAVDEGYAAGFFGVHRLAGLQDLLGIPDDVAPIGVVTVGRPAPDRRSGSLRRGWRDLGSVLHWERWGGSGPAAAERSAPS